MARDASGDGPVYFGGFLVVYGEQGDDAELALPREVVRRFLDPGSRGAGIPVNVNHDEAATIGAVRGLFDFDVGLFCVGRVYSKAFLDIVRSAAAKSYLVARGPQNGLPPDAVIEYLSTSYPGLSLSNAPVPGSDGAVLPGCEEFFRHVAVCGVGRRRGTIAVYGRDVDWIVARFSSLLSGDEVADVRSWVASGGRGDGGDDDADPFRADVFSLLASSIDASYVRERFSKLQRDKKIARIGTGTYIKASERPALRDDGDDGDGGDGDGDDARAAGDPARSIKGGLFRCEREVEAATTTTSGDVAMAAPSGGAPPAVGPQSATPAPYFPGDCVYLSRDAFLTLVGATAPRTPSPQFAGAAVPSPEFGFAQGAGHNSPAGGVMDYGAAGVRWSPPSAAVAPAVLRHAPPGGDGDRYRLGGFYGGYAHETPCCSHGGHHHREAARHLDEGGCCDGRACGVRSGARGGGRDDPRDWDRGPERPTRQTHPQHPRKRGRSPERGDAGNGEDDDDSDGGAAVHRLPGEAGYSRARRRLKEDGDGDGRTRNTGPPPAAAAAMDVTAFGELRATLRDIRNELALIAAAPTRSAAVAAAPAAAGSGAAAPSAGDDVPSQSPALNDRRVADRTAEGLGKSVAQEGVHDNAERTPGAGIVNASCVPDFRGEGTALAEGVGVGGGGGGGGGAAASLLDANRRLFVAALNRLE